jgi:dTDP-4-dehydrorhamnose reductase
VVLQQKVVTEDALKQQSETWMNSATVWAVIEPLSGKEYFAAKQVNAEISVKLTLRYRKDVVSDMRVAFGNRVFEVLSFSSVSKLKFQKERLVREEENINSVEIWGGAEYSVVRVKNTVYDQLACNNHEIRIEDLDLFHDAGIKKVRYPLLWEKYVNNEEEFFRLHDKRISRLLELGIRPIAGLLHHGSGPFFTDLYDKDFPSLLSEFAYIIASRYPSIDLYTPVNEPLTTARFSGLYGFWYPHLKDDNSFVRIFLNELKGIIMSMEAVRSINPNAGLVQTEDLGKILSTPELEYQAHFENERRWSTYDFLIGKIDQNHTMYRYFAESGADDKDFEYFIKNSIKPDICGFNYYVTSERYLDQNLGKYPAGFHGGNVFQRYADVEVVRANIPEQISLTGLLKEAWGKVSASTCLNRDSYCL